MPTRSTNRAALQASAAEEPAILNDENADAIIGVGCISIGRMGWRCLNALLCAARCLCLLQIPLGSFHVAHGIRLGAQQGMQQIILVILGDDVLDIELLIRCKAAADLGGVNGLHIDIELCGLRLDLLRLGLGLVNRRLLGIAQAP